MACLPVLWYKIMTKDGGRVSLLMKRTRCSLQSDISSAHFYSCALCTTLQSQCKTNICWGLSCFQCGLEPLKQSRGHFSTVLEGQTPPHWLRTGFSGGLCICLCSQDKQKGVRNPSHMRLLGGLPVWESKRQPQSASVERGKQLYSDTKHPHVQSKDAHPCTYARAIRPVATSKFKTRKTTRIRSSSNWI